MKTKFFSLATSVLVLLITVSLLPATNVSAKEKIRIGTGGPGGTYYYIGAGIAEVLNKWGGFDATSMSAAGGGQNLRYIDSGEIEMATIAAQQLIDGFKGLKPFTKKIDVRIGFFMYQDPYEVVVLDESPLRTIHDLKGRKVSVGAMGSGIEGKTKIIFKIYGLTYDDISPVFLGSNKGVNALKDGVVDAAVVMGYPPTRAIVSISTVRKVRILPMNAEMITRIITEHPFLSPFTILPNTYKNQPAELRVVAENSSICFSSKMPDDTVYKIVKTTFEHLDYLGKVHKAGKRLSLEKACSLKIGVPYHPGAIRYFKEVGIWK